MVNDTIAALCTNTQLHKMGGRLKEPEVCVDQGEKHGWMAMEVLKKKHQRICRNWNSLFALILWLLHFQKFYNS